jgi:hypothetical protein
VYLETSAKDATNVNTIFEILLRRAVVQRIGKGVGKEDKIKCSVQ